VRLDRTGREFARGCTDSPARSGARSRRARHRSARSGLDAGVARTAARTTFEQVTPVWRAERPHGGRPRPEHPPGAHGPTRPTRQTVPETHRARPCVHRGARASQRPRRAPRGGRGPGQHVGSEELPDDLRPDPVHDGIDALQPRRLDEGSLRNGTDPVATVCARVVGPRRAGCSYPGFIGTFDVAHRIDGSSRNRQETDQAMQFCASTLEVFRFHAIRLSTPGTRTGLGISRPSLGTRA
jgi:hypothetical protein